MFGVYRAIVLAIGTCAMLIHIIYVRRAGIFGRISDKTPPECLASNVISIFFAIPQCYLGRVGFPLLFLMCSWETGEKKNSLLLQRTVLYEETFYLRGVVTYYIDIFILFEIYQTDSILSVDRDIKVT